MPTSFNMDNMTRLFNKYSYRLIIQKCIIELTEQPVIKINNVADRPYRAVTVPDQPTSSQLN